MRSASSRGTPSIDIALRTAVAWGYVATVPDDVVQHFGKVIGTLTKVTSR